MFQFPVFPVFVICVVALFALVAVSDILGWRLNPFAFRKEPRFRLTRFEWLPGVATVECSDARNGMRMISSPMATYRADVIGRDEDYDELKKVAETDLFMQESSSFFSYDITDTANHNMHSTVARSEG